MANTFTLKSSAYGGRYMELVCTQAKDEANNKSVITWTLSSVGGEVNYYATGPTTVIINGTQVYYKERLNWDEKVFPVKKGSVGGTITIDHNTDGSKTIPVSLSTRVYYTTVQTHKGDWELDSLPGGATLISAPDFNDTQTPTITYANPRGNNVDALEVCIADSAGWYAYVPYRPVNKTGSLSYTFTKEDIAILKTKAKGTTLEIMFVLRTTIDGVYYPSAIKKTFTMTENADTKPTVKVSPSPSNPSSFPSSLASLYIQGKSRVKVQLTSEGKYGATVQSYVAEVDESRYGSYSLQPTTQTTITTDTLISPGEVSVVGEAIDSRGFKGTASTKISVLEYKKPSVSPLGNENAIQCYRSDGNGVRVGNSTSVWIKAKRSYYTLSGNNHCALQWRRKLSTETWNDGTHLWTDLITKATTNTDEYNALVSGAFELTKSYAVQIRAVDDLGEYDVKDFEIPTQDVTLHLGKGGKNVTIGDYCDYTEENTFRSAWKAIFDKGIHGTLNGTMNGTVNGTMTQLWAGDVLAFAESCPSGFTPFFTGQSSTNVPTTGNYQYSSGFICKRSDTQITVVIFSYYSGDLAINTYYDTAGGWLGWRYLKTTT